MGVDTNRTTSNHLDHFLDSKMAFKLKRESAIQREIKILLWISNLT